MGTKMTPNLIQRIHRAWRASSDGAILPAALLALAMLLAACSGGASSDESTEEAMPAVEVAPIVSATGVVVPPAESTLSFAISGVVVEVLVEEGAFVNEGDEIARLDTTLLDADVAEAEASLEVARANLRKAQAGARPEEIEQAGYDLNAATAEVSRAVAERDSVVNAATEAEIAAAQADLQAAFVSQKIAQDAYDVATGWAQNQDEDFQEQVPETGLETDPDEIEATGESLAVANQNLAAAQAYLDDLLNGADPNDVQLANAQVWVAAAERDAAEAYLALLQAGPRPENIAVAEAQVAESEVAVEAARAARERAVLRAPFDGIVGTVYIRANEWVAPGQAVALIGSAGPFQVETTDLNEIDVARIEIGNSASITFDALPGITVEGTIIRIAQKSTEGAGVNYTVLVELDEAPENLRWGMTAFVDIAVE